MDFQHSQRAQPYMAALDRGACEVAKRRSAIVRARAATLMAAEAIDGYARFGLLHELAPNQVGAPSARPTVLDAAIPS
jgi:hypothetical protein